jgi:hypothetical protein
LPKSKNRTIQTPSDGLDDLIVGAKNAKVGKEYSAGKSYVVFGKQHNTNTIPFF